MCIFLPFLVVHRDCYMMYWSLLLLVCIFISKYYNLCICLGQYPPLDVFIKFFQQFIIDKKSFVNVNDKIFVIYISIKTNYYFKNIVSLKGKLMNPKWLIKSIWETDTMVTNKVNFQIKNRKNVEKKSTIDY